MKRFFTPLAALVAVALLAGGCSDGTAPVDLVDQDRSEAEVGTVTGQSHDDHSQEGFVDVSDAVVTVPPDAEVWHKTVRFANNLVGCDVFDNESDYSGKIDTGNSGTYTIPGTNIQVTLSSPATNTYNVSIQSGYVMTDIFLKQGGSPGDINQWYHFVPGVSSASGLTTDGNALSHFSVCVNDAPVVELQDLVVTKDAFASFDRTVAWTLTKKVNGQANVAFTGTAGDQFNWVWQVVATKNETIDNYLVTGEITITNPNPVDVDVDVEDMLNDGTIAAVDCDPVTAGSQASGTVPADGVLICSYVATPAGAMATLNTATVEVTGYEPPENSIGDIEGDTADAPITWVENLIGDDEVDLEDLYLDYLETISDTTTENFNESYTCSSDVDDYVVGVIQEQIVNTATLTGDVTDLEASATVNITCALVWKGETATGEGPRWRANLWFMYTPWNAGPVKLIAGQHYHAGDITMVSDNGTTTITITLNSGFRWADVSENLKIQDFAAPPTGNQAPGKFAWKSTESGMVATVDVPTAAYYIIHADVERLVLP